MNSMSSGISLCGIDLNNIVLFNIDLSRFLNRSEEDKKIHDFFLQLDAGDFGLCKNATFRVEGVGMEVRELSSREYQLLLKSTPSFSTIKGILSPTAAPIEFGIGCGKAQHIFRILIGEQSQYLFAASGQSIRFSLSLSPQQLAAIRECVNLYLGRDVPKYVIEYL